MSFLRRRTIPGLFLAAAVLLGGGVQMAAPAAGAAVTAPARPALVPKGIAGVCTAIQDGEYTYLGNRLYRCTYVWGLGYYWVEQPAACGAAPAAREVAARCA